MSHPPEEWDDDAGSALRESEERLRFSLEAGRLGFWQHDQVTGELITSDLCKAHFGRPPGEPFTHYEALKCVHPDDRDPIREMIDRAILTGENYVLEYRVLWPDGSIRWLMVRGRASYNAAGRAVRTFGVTLDITERKAAEARQAEQAERLRRLSESLSEAARRKDEFLAMLAHELRNPLAPMVNALEILRADPNHDAGTKARAVLERQLRHMSRLVDDLLDVSRINTGKIMLKRERLDLAAVVERSMENVRGFIEARGHTLEAELPAAPVPVEADAVRLEQVITNLLNNAAKYTAPGGQICVALDTDGAFARLRVRDTGMGIAPELLDAVFDLFTQGERGLDRAEGGLGLGLWLVHRLVQLHGGTVEAFSDGPGRGSEFVVRLPLLETEAGAIDGDDEAPDLPQSAPSASPANLTPDTQHPTPHPLLVVDDNRDAAETLAELIRIWGFEVDVAYDGLAALEHVREREPAIVFLDIGMPGLNGYEVARRLREERRFASTVLVALTGYGQEEDRERSRAAGFDHHLVKPVEIDELEQLLDTVDRSIRDHA